MGCPIITDADGYFLVFLLGGTAQFQAEQDMGRAKNNMASAAAAAAAFAKGVPLEGDRQFKLDVPLGSNEEKFTCIKFDLFGCELCLKCPSEINWCVWCPSKFHFLMHVRLLRMLY